MYITDGPHTNYSGTGIHEQSKTAHQYVYSGMKPMRLTGLVCADCTSPVEFLPSAHSFCSRCAYKEENKPLWGTMPGDGKFRG